MDFLKNLKESKAVKAIQGFYSKHVIRKLFLTILCVALLIGIIYMFPALFVKSRSVPDVKSAPLSESLGEIAKDEGKILVAENGGRQLYLSTADMIFEMVDQATGQTISSGDASAEEGSDKALISVQYLGEDNNLYEWNSYDNSVVLGSYDMKRIADGVSIHMNFNEGESQRFYEYCPKKMSIERYEEFFLGGLERAKEAGEITAAQEQRYVMALGLVYKKSIMEECYSVTYTGTPPVSAVKQMLEIVRIVGYTQDMLFEDAEQFGFTVVIAEPANFDITVEATLENGEFVVRMPAGQMVSANDYYSIQNVKFLPNFGAAASTDYEEGYILVPDGAGALFAFNSNQPTIKDYERPVYDNDYYKDYYFMPEYGEELMMPVYGMGYGPEENTEKGFFAIIESGAHNAYINVKLAGSAEGSSKYNRAYVSFDINQFQRVKINGAYSENSANYLVQTGMQDIDCTVRYRMYGGQVTYFDMAKDYRAYLVDRYGLDTSYNDGAGSLYLEFVGALSLKKRIVGIPYNSVYSMTPYDELMEIMKDLSDVRFQVQYDGAFNGGVDGKMNSEAKLTGANGSKKELRSLLDYADNNGFDFYLSVAPAKVSEGGNGFMAGSHALRDFANEEALLYRYMPAIGILSGELYDGVSHNGYYLLAPRYLDYAVDGFLKDAKDYDKIAIMGLAGMYYADYRFNNMLNGAQGAAVISENLAKFSDKKVALENPFMDNIAYGSIAVDVSKESSDYATFSHTIPFRQLVMNGICDYTTENVNISSKNAEYFVLQAAELGSYPKYILTSKPVTSLKNTDYHYLYSAQYDLLKDGIKAMYAQIADIRGRIGTNEIAGHTCLAEKVYKTTYANGVEVIVNYNLHSVELEDGTVLEAEAYRIEGGNKCERVMGKQKDFGSDPFHTTSLRCRRKLGWISCSRKQSQHDHKFESKLSNSHWYARFSGQGGVRMKKGKKLPYRVKRKINGLIFVAPFLIGFIAFFLIPIINTIYYSFNKVGVGEMGGMTFTFNGIQNYIDLFKTEVTTTSTTMARLFTEQNRDMLLSVPLIVIFSLFMALLANQKFKGRAFVRLIFFLPIILGIEVVTSMLTMTTGTESLDTGSQLVSGSYITIFLVRVLDVPMRVLYPIITYIENIFTLISQAGVQTLVYLTALQSISPSMYEVAKMEGATAYETFWKVTIPSIMHITLFVIVYTIVQLFIASPVAEEVYAFAFKQNKIGISSALSVVYIFNVLIVLGLVMLLLRKVVKKNEK